jgi:hypothetical protein
MNSRGDCQISLLGRIPHCLNTAKGACSFVETVSSVLRSCGLLQNFWCEFAVHVASSGEGRKGGKSEEESYRNLITLRFIRIYCR